MKRLRDFWNNLKWKPDYSNPNDIKAMVIRDTSSSIYMLFGIILISSAMLEFAIVFAGYPSVLDMVENKYRAGEIGNFTYTWLPFVALLNGLVLSTYALYKGVKTIKHD